MLMPICVKRVGEGGPTPRMGQNVNRARVSSSFFHLWDSVIVKDFMGIKLLYLCVSDNLYLQEDPLSSTKWLQHFTRRMCDV